MGVKDLWNILSPSCDRKPLYELQGKAIAIDLSCWIVDSQTVTDNMIQPKMYLRNLFFRTSYLLLHNIFPVFVLEGDAPTLKHNTIAKRNEIRKGATQRKTAAKGGRSNFNHIIKECEELLRYLGLTCVKGHGEAEAMCAYLNFDGLVQGCISQDSDCFLYGAKTVYRNFCMSASGGSVDEYTIDKIQENFSLGRNKMIALALLCGCDYDEGVNGVGKEAALKLFKMVEENEIIHRIKKWRTDSSMYDALEAEISNPNICTNCGHSGKLRSHTKNGCEECDTVEKCYDLYKEKRNLISNELSIRKKALNAEDFPNQELIDEFLVRKGSVPSKLDLQWKKPQIVKLIYFTEKKLQWEPSYAFAKIFPLSTRWQLLNIIETPIERRLKVPGVFVPAEIRKTRNLRSVLSYEVLWLDDYDILEGLSLTSTSDKENEDGNSNSISEYITVEPQDAFNNCYPMIVQKFEEAKNAKKKKKTTKSRKKKEIEGDKENDNLESMSLKTKPKKRSKKKCDEVLGNKKISDFIQVDKKIDALEKSFDKMDITPKRPKKCEKDPLKVISGNILQSPEINYSEFRNKIFKDTHMNSNSSPKPKKKGPQFAKILETENSNSVLNGSLKQMFDQLTPDDFTNDISDSYDLSLIIENICKRKTIPVYTENNEKLHDFSLDEDVKCLNLSKNENSNNISYDEFGDLDKTYVPLYKRINNFKNSSVDNKSKQIEKKERISIGIEKLLLNGTSCSLNDDAY